MGVQYIQLFSAFANSKNPKHLQLETVSKISQTRNIRSKKLHVMQNFILHVQLLESIPVEALVVVGRGSASADCLHESGHTVLLQVAGPVVQVVLVGLEEVVDVGQVHASGDAPHDSHRVHAQGHSEHTSTELGVVSLLGRIASISPADRIVEQVIVVGGVRSFVVERWDGVGRVGDGRVCRIPQGLGVRHELPQACYENTN